MLESQIITNEKLPNIHPGEILKEEFLNAMGISAYRLAKEINVPETRISEIVHGKRSITADTAIRFSKFFATYLTTLTILAVKIFLDCFHLFRHLFIPPFTINQLYY